MTTFKILFVYFFSQNRKDRHLTMKKVVKLTQIMGFIGEKFAPPPPPEVPDEVKTKVEKPLTLIQSNFPQCFGSQKLATRIFIFIIIF
jgi:hypothetical protein